MGSSLKEILSKNRAFFTLAFVFVVISRLPYIFNGPGPIGDAWQILVVARKLWETHQYQPSRLFGYPLHEMTTALLVGVGSYVWSNFATLFIYLFSILVFAKIVWLLDLPHKRMLVVLYCFFPQFWKNSSVTLDYCWGVTFILLGFYFLLKERPLVSAVMIGLAAGFRPTNILFVAPFTFYLFTKKQYKLIFLYGLVAGLTSFFSFTIVWMTYGLQIFLAPFKVSTASYLRSYLLEAGYRFIFSMGLLPFLWTGGFLFVKSKAIFKKKDVLDGLLLLCIGVVLFSFFKFPLKTAYLIPAFPFLFFLVSRYATKKQMVIFTVLCLSYAVVNFDLRGGSSGRREIKFQVRPGWMIDDYHQRKDHLAIRSVVNLDLPQPSLVLTGRGPMFYLDNKDIRKAGPKMFKHLTKEIFYADSLDREELEQALKNGVKLYYLEDSRRAIEDRIKGPVSELDAEVILNKTLGIYSGILS